MKNLERRKSVKARVGCVKMGAQIANESFKRAVKSSTA